MPTKDGNFTYQDSVTLREYLESRIMSIEKAVAVAQQVLEMRLGGMNEFREQLKEQAAHFVTRDELSKGCDVCKSDIRSLRETRAEIAGKASLNAFYIAFIVGLAGFVLGLLDLILRVAK